jgi:glycosyltransferase involved in cell wall biosynthesis
VEKDYIFDAPVGADMEHFKPGLDGNWVRKRYAIDGDLVLYIGQLHGAQYVELFIRAANVVLHKRPGARFMIVGEGFLEHQLKGLAHDLGLGKKIIFTGAVIHEDVPHYVSAATVCVAPFRDTEVTRCKSPLKIVEYLSSGKPIVASYVGEVRNMAGGVAVLVEPGNHYALAEGILKLLNNKKLRETLGRVARKRVENKYNWEKTAASLLTAYEKICQE